MGFARLYALGVLIALVLCGGVGLAQGQTPKLYWADYANAKIQSSDPDGSNVTHLVAGLSNPYGVGVDAAAGMDKTIPQAATMGLVGLAGVVVLRRRRKWRLRLWPSSLLVFCPLRGVKRDGKAMKKLAGIAFAISLVCPGSFCAGQATIAAVRVVAYNTCNNPDDLIEDAWFSTIFSAIANESVNGIAKRPDIVAVSETDTGSSARLVQVLNEVYAVSTYNVVTSSSVGGDRTGLVYDSSTVALLGSSDLTGVGTHPIMRAHFRPVGYTSPESEFYVYAVHLKSGSSASDKAMRAAEAINLRSNADALGEGRHIIYAGDFNMIGSSEGAWSNMLASGNGQAFDTADTPGDWRDHEEFKSLHSQNPRSPMDDRFDLQFVSGEFLDGEGLEYISDSYRVFGNNGTHTLNGSISTGSGSSLTVLAALENASDHLPIVADYQVPEPATLSLLVVGGVLAVGRGSRIRRGRRREA